MVQANWLGVSLRGLTLFSYPRLGFPQGNILFTNELVRRYGDQGLVAISVHPGLIETELMREHSWLIRTITVMLILPIYTTFSLFFIIILQSGTNRL